MHVSLSASFPFLPSCSLKKDLRIKRLKESLKKFEKKNLESENFEIFTIAKNNA